jgi:DoxX-like family
VGGASSRRDPAGRRGLLCDALRFVTECLDDVRLPHRIRPLLPILKLAAAAGLVAGLWIEHLGAITALCVTVYFALAVGAHIRVRDFGRNIFNATVLLAFSAYVLRTFL